MNCIAYTFIIPHKNTPDLLRKCIDSIPHRDDVQIIVVDDNSDADKVDFEHFPGLNEPCTEVHLTKEGRGAGYARNVGLQHTVGKWIVFADADDFFHTEALEEAMTQYKNSDSDVVFFMGDAIKIPSGEMSCRADDLNNAIEEFHNTNDYTKAILLSVPWRKFFSHNFIKSNHLFFNEVQWSNDVVFMGKVAVCVRNIQMSLLSIYCTTESDNTLWKNTSIECALVRFVEECKNAKILKLKYGNVASVFYWQFQTWFTLYKHSKIKALYYWPYACFMGGFGFMKQFYNTILMSIHKHI